MNNILIIYAGPGGIAPSTKAKYAEALEGVDFEWLTVKGPGGGTSFEREVERNRGADGRLLPFYTKQAKRPIAKVILIVFSAGYGFARAMFKHEQDREAIDGFLAVDAIHGSIPKARGTAAQAYRLAAAIRKKHDDPRDYLDASQMEGFVAYCKRAADREAFACLISSEITPYYASTRETSDYITLSLDIEEDAGDFSVCWQKGNNKAAHIKACQVTGPQMARERLLPWLMDVSPPAPPIVAPEPPGEPQSGIEPWLDSALTLGQRCVLWSQAEMESGVKEVTKNWSTRIAEYFEGITRIIGGREKILGIDRGNWCAAGATFAEEECHIPDIDGPLVTIRRASGMEMQRDAMKAGRWRPADLWFAGQWKPQVGDYVIYNRGKTTGPQAWWRHVARVAQVGSGFNYIDINANNGNTWQLKRRSALMGGNPGAGQTFKNPAVRNPDLLGFVEVTTVERDEVSDLFDLTQGIGPGVDLSTAKSTEEAIKRLDDKLEELDKKKKLTSG